MTEGNSVDDICDKQLTLYNYILLAKQ